MKKNHLTILGCGTSTGVPILGCNCKICQSNEPKNQRFRTSVLIHSGNNKKILIDTTPDLRSQLLREKIDWIDATIITHDHADHLHGIDDLRAFCFLREDDLPVYTYPDCAQRMQQKFPYIFDRINYFKDKPIIGGGIPRLSLNQLKLDRSILVEKESFEFFKLAHGHIPSMGFIHQKMAYVVDCNHLSVKQLTYLANKKLELLILDLNGDKPHQTHLHFEKSIEYAKTIQAQTTYFIHLTHDHDYFELEKRVKNEDHSFNVCYDGLTLQYGNAC